MLDRAIALRRRTTSRLENDDIEVARQGRLQPLGIGQAALLRDLVVQNALTRSRANALRQHLENLRQRWRRLNTSWVSRPDEQLLQQHSESVDVRRYGYTLAVQLFGSGVERSERASVMLSELRR